MIDNNVLFPQPIQGPATTNKSTARQGRSNEPGSTSAFAKVLDQTISGQPVGLSQHARERLQSRGISLSESDMKELAGAVDSVAQKGGKESLIMMGDAALVVSVKNRTVVTAMDRQSMRGNVFTNIDSAVIL